MRLLRILFDDYTPLEHAAYAVAIQLVVLALFGWFDFHAALAGGTMLGIGFFVGREHAQAERRWQPQWGPLTDFSGFNLRKWDRGSVLDLAWPVVACVVVAGVVAFIWR